VEDALRRSGAWDFVRHLARGADTPVGEAGSQLSAGQRQRIAVARALVRRPKLLILDEATAHLDAAAEAELWESLRALRGETTIVAISHHAAFLAFADQVFRLEPVRAAVEALSGEVAVEPLLLSAPDPRPQAARRARATRWSTSR